MFLCNLRAILLQFKNIIEKIHIPDSCIKCFDNFDRLAEDPVVSLNIIEVDNWSPIGHVLKHISEQMQNIYEQAERYHEWRSNPERNENIDPSSGGPNNYNNFDKVQ